MASNSPSTAAGSSQPNLSDALGSIGQSSATETGGSNTASATASSGSGSATGSGSGSASATQGTAGTISGAPTLGVSSASVSQITGAPSLTSGLDIPGLTGAPTLSGYYSIAPQTVPPMAGAPYLAKNNLPENFVFIIVGAVIAFVALVIIAWRVGTSWSINRRFRRHEGAAGTGAGKASYTPLSDFKQKPAATSTHDLKELSKLPKNFQSVPSLFFSPTAEVARHSMRPTTANSSNTHMPAGHYRDASRN